MRILSFAMSSSSTNFTSVWKGIEGSKTVEVCLTCLLFAKSLRFLRSPLVKIPLHLRLMIDAFSLHQPFSTSYWTLSAKWRTVSLSFFVKLRASSCA